MVHFAETAHVPEHTHTYTKIKHYGQKLVLTWYNSQMKSDCRNVSQALHWTEKFLVLVFLSV